MRIVCEDRWVKDLWWKDRWFKDRLFQDRHILNTKFPWRKNFSDSEIQKYIFSKYCNYRKIKNDKMTFSPSESLFSKWHPSKQSHRTLTVTDLKAILNFWIGISCPISCKLSSTAGSRSKLFFLSLEFTETFWSVSSRFISLHFLPFNIFKSTMESGQFVYPYRKVIRIKVAGRRSKIQKIHFDRPFWPMTVYIRLDAIIENTRF